MAAGRAEKTTRAPLCMMAAAVVSRITNELVFSLMAGLQPIGDRFAVAFAAGTRRSGQTGQLEIGMIVQQAGELLPHQPVASQYGGFDFFHVFLLSRGLTEALP